MPPGPQVCQGGFCACPEAGVMETLELFCVFLGVFMCKKQRLVMRRGLVLLNGLSSSKFSNEITRMNV